MTEPPSTRDADSPASTAGLASRLCRWLAPVAALLLSLLPPPEGLSQAAWHAAAICLWMAVWWMTEAVPLAATALLPLPLFPLAGVLSLEKTAAAYANPLLFLFLGGFLMARSLTVWQLDKRLAGAVVRYVGDSPRRTVGAVMAVTAFLSLWISNTAAAMVMLPIGQSLAERASGVEGPGRAAFSRATLLGIAYAATIGGMGTLIGTPPNALFAAYMSQVHGVTIGFAEWLVVGLPLVLLLTPLAWWVLTAIVFRVPRAASPRPRDSDGPPTAWNASQRRTAAVLCLAVVLWLSRPLLESLFGDLPFSDAAIAIGAALLLFVLPAGAPERRGPLLTWQEAEAIRWDVLLLFGGGLALAEGISATGLSAWLGVAASALKGALPTILLMFAICALVLLLGELASNTAVAAIFLPVAGSVAVGIGESPATLALAVALAATLGFMLPVATPPNAIAYGTGRIGARDMLRAGALLDLIGLALVVAAVVSLGAWVFG